MLLKNRLGYDDALDVVGIHGVGGTWGALATGLFASSAVNGVDGLFFGNSWQFVVQAISVVATWAYVYVMSRLLFWGISCIMPLRVSPDAEHVGLDLSEHNERAYSL